MICVSLVWSDDAAAAAAWRPLGQLQPRPQRLHVGQERAGVPPPPPATEGAHERRIHAQSKHEVRNC